MFARGESTREGTHKIHISKQQRTSRKCVVTIDGMDDDLDLGRITKMIRKTFHCNAAIVRKKDYEDIVEVNEAKRDDGGFMSLEEMINYQTTLKKNRPSDGKPVLHLAGGEVIQLQGDYREGVVELFQEADIVLDKSRLVVHG